MRAVIGKKNSRAGAVGRERELWFQLFKGIFIMDFANECLKGTL